jgi:hypothetical protein
LPQNTKPVCGKKLNLNMVCVLRPRNICTVLGKVSQVEEEDTIVLEREVMLLYFLRKGGVTFWAPKKRIRNPSHYIFMVVS